MKNNEYNYNISELVDLLTNTQIKEVKFSNKSQYTNQIKKITKELDFFLKKKKIKLTPQIMRKIMFVGIANLLVWEIKEQMLSNKKSYYDLLEKALEINVIRNSVTNSMMKDFNEFEFSRNRFTELRKKNKKWVTELMKAINKGS